MSFTKGDSFPVGIVHLVKTWLDSKIRYKLNYRVWMDEASSKVFIDADGDLVLKDFEIDKDIKQRGFPGVFFGNIKGSVLIINQMSSLDAYNRIKDYYLLLLNNCLGKSAEEQQKWILEGKPIFKLREGLIEASESYIRALPANPSLLEMKDLAKQVLEGLLEYANQGRDKYGIKMREYAERI